MKRHVSPFAELTGMEKQIRWLEYQSIRLPYLEASLDEPIVEEKDLSAAEFPKEDQPTQQTKWSSAHTPSCEKNEDAVQFKPTIETNMENAVRRSSAPSPVSFASNQALQKDEADSSLASLRMRTAPTYGTFPHADVNPIRHRQYDAVIARIRQAEFRSRKSGVQTVLQGSKQL